MRYIDTSGYQPDSTWLTKADALTKELLDAKTITEKHKIIDDNQAFWGELKDFLLAISLEKCWYSESKNTYSYMHVDHFRPKKKAIGVDKIDYGGYWWLAFDWTNYRISGAVGNVLKRDKFAVLKYKASKPDDLLDDEIIYLLDPTEIEDVSKITFNSNGEVMSIDKDKNSWDYKRADYTIKTLKLNYKKLKDARKVSWAECSNLILETEKLIQDNCQNPSANRRGQIKQKLKQLKKLTKASSEFSEAIKTCLISSGLEWARKCAA